MVLALLRTCCEPLPAKLWYPLMLRHQWLGYGKRSKQVPRSPKQPSLSIAWLLGICRVKPSSHHLKHCKKYFLLARQQCNKNYLGQSLTLPGPKMSQVLNIAGKWLGWSKCHHRTMSYQECSFWQKKLELVCYTISIMENMPRMAMMAMRSTYHGSVVKNVSHLWFHQTNPVRKLSQIPSAKSFPNTKNIWLQLDSYVFFYLLVCVRVTVCVLCYA